VEPENGEPMTDSGPDQPPQSLRLIFAYDGDDVQLVAQHRVDVVVTGAEMPLHQVPGEAVEVRDAEGAVLGRVPIQPGLTASLEVFPENHDDPITRTDLPQSQGSFTVVVPLDPTADHVTVVRVAAEPRASSSGPAVPSAPAPARSPDQARSGDEAAPPAPPEPSGPPAPAVVELASFPIEDP
jgi:hypothetical protein